MTRKAILLGGALTFALTATAFAQADTQTKPAHHLRHHAKHHAATASLHRSSPAERDATRDLNLQQASMVQTAAPAPYTRNMQNAPPGDRGLTPARRLPNGNALQGAAAAGGAKDSGAPPARY